MKFTEKLIKIFSRKDAVGGGGSVWQPSQRGLQPQTLPALCHVSKDPPQNP